MIWIALSVISCLILGVKILKSTYILIKLSYLIYSMIIFSFFLGLLIEITLGYKFNLPSKLYDYDSLNNNFFIINLLIQLIFLIFKKKIKTNNIDFLYYKKDKNETILIFIYSLLTMIGYLAVSETFIKSKIF